MIINKLEFKNINSYGNNLQTLTFDEDGGLILLNANNGFGKSSIKQAIELCIFGKVQGKSGKKLALTKLPNRRNGNLYTGVYFKNQNNDDIIMKRFLQPNNFEMSVNDNLISERYKVMSEKEREKIIGYNYDVFKSFISINMNDFKNFISLNKEDKENLLNKIFNLNELDTLYSITNELDNNNNKLINGLEDLIYKNEQTILEYRQTILNIKNKQQFSKDERLIELKNSINDKKPIYLELEENIKKCDEERTESNIKNNKLSKLSSDKEREKTKLELELESLEEKVKLYDSGKCPMCETDLIDDTHKKHLEHFKEQILEKNNLLSECNKYLDKCVLEEFKIKNNIDSIYKRKSELNTKLSDLKIELGTLNKEYKALRDTVDDNITPTLENNITELKSINIDKKELLINLNKKAKNYQELKKMFSFDGIRKSMIKNALIPINEHLNYFLTELKSEYNAVLNDDFDADIMELGILNIDPETLSKGEDKKINIAIALSYLKMVLSLKHSNIIFLDEVFDSLDIENISLIISLLDKIAKTHNINIIIVYHGMEQLVDTKIFKKIIRINKDIFSNIEVFENNI